MGLTTLILAMPLSIGVVSAGDNGAVFRAVWTKNCSAAGHEAICLTAPLISGSAVTALDVLRDIYPDLGSDGKGKRFAGGEAVEAASDPDLGSPKDRAVNLSASDTAEIAVIDAGSTAYAAAVSAGVVTVAEIRPAYKPLGRLLVATDPGGPTDGYRLLLAAPDSPVAVTVSRHFNSQEQFEALHLVGVVGGALVDLYDGPYFYSLGEATEHCELLDHQEAVTTLEVQNDRHHGLADVGIVIDYVASCVNGEARQQVDTKTFPLRLSYDGDRYDADSSALDDFNASFAE